MNKKLSDIEHYQEDVLRDFEKAKLIPFDNLLKEMHLAKQADSNFMKRDARINIRVSSTDLNMIRRVAVQEEGYLIHKFAAGRLIDKGHTQL